jgi:predicted lipoprotein with Yx(FWY)xxD motif
MTPGLPGAVAKGRRPRRLALGTLSLMAVVSAACASPGTAITTPFATTAPAHLHGNKDEVKVSNVPGLGPVLADGQGLTLYLYATDRQGRPSRCYGICAVQWPPLILSPGVTRPVAGPGIEAGLLGTALRTDGTTQITYNGWPLYLWPPDHSPGTATGQALTNAGGLWYVVDPAGNAVKTR